VIMGGKIVKVLLPVLSYSKQAHAHTHTHSRSWSNSIPNSKKKFTIEMYRISKDLPFGYWVDFETGGVLSLTVLQILRGRQGLLVLVVFGAHNMDRTRYIVRTFSPCSSLVLWISSDLQDLSCMEHFLTCSIRIIHI
jgi:hypothetical protein